MRWSLLRVRNQQTPEAVHSHLQCYFAARIAAPLSLSLLYLLILVSSPIPPIISCSSTTTHQHYQPAELLGLLKQASANAGQGGS